MFSQDPRGELLEEVEVYADGILPVRRPDSTWNWPENAELRNNIRFDEVNKWKIINPSGYSAPLAEGTNYTYGESLEVKATWWKKVLTHIFSVDNPQQTAADLIDNVSVGVGHEPDTQHHSFAFFGENENVTFNITGNEQGTKFIIKPNNNQYYFLFWANTSELVGWQGYVHITVDSYDFPYITNTSANNFVFNNLCLKEESAVFLNGADMQIVVRTNGDSANSVTSYPWNDNEKIKFKLTWDDGTTEIVKSFNSWDENNPPHYDPSNPPYSSSSNPSIPTSLYGHSFTCIPNFTSNPLWIDGDVHDFKGWYIGNFDGHEDDFDPADYATDTKFIPYVAGSNDFTSPRIMAAQRNIMLTAIYSRSSGSRYTITYYSGLDDVTVV